MKFPRNSKIPKTRIPIFVSHPHFLGATFFASHLLVAKFLGVGGIFYIREFRIPYYVIPQLELRISIWNSSFLGVRGYLLSKI